MVSVKLENELQYQFSAHAKYAQLLIRIEPRQESYEEAKRIIDAERIDIIEEKRLSAEFVLVLLGIKDMRQIALNLTEKGFLVRGINAFCSDGC